LVDDDNVGCSRIFTHSDEAKHAEEDMGCVIGKREEIWASIVKSRGERKGSNVSIVATLVTLYSR
jgi:hypothetical protein